MGKHSDLVPISVDETELYDEAGVEIFWVQSSEARFLRDPYVREKEVLTND